MEKRGDDILRLYVNMANRGVLFFGLTLQINGLVITGTAISVKEYLTELGNTFRDSVTGAIFQTDKTMDMTDVEVHQMGNQMKEQFSRIAEEYQKSALAGDKKEPPSVEDYLHLKDVKYVVPTSIFINQPIFPYWRFGLSEITGWTLGNAE